MKNIFSKNVVSRVSNGLAVTTAALLLVACGGAPNEGSSGNGSSGQANSSSSSSSGGVKPDIPDSADPAAKVVHRLNKVEFQNTITDMFYGLDIDVTASLPDDSSLYGFDNISEVQSLNGTIFSFYNEATEQAVNAALKDGAKAGDGNDLADKLVSCSLANVNRACVENTLKSFTRRAWRRPVNSEEISELLSLAETADGDWKEGLSRSMQATLLSPHFLFRVELDPNPGSGEIRLLNDHELATRLSYYLWSTMPDQELSDAADRGGLNTPEEISKQVKRMMASPKAKALRDNFFGQWLFTRALQSPLIKSSTEFTGELQNSMMTETNMLLDRVISGELDLPGMLTLNETYVDERLANFYGISGVSGDNFQKVSLDGTNRRGLLTQAGLMAILADNDVTNPVIRGKWVSEEMLCTEPPPPPGNAVPQFSDEVFPGAARDRLANIIVGPCAGCHALMDPAGLALENFDPIGKWRDQEVFRGEVYDIFTAGQIPQLDNPFSNAIELVEGIAANDKFIHCAAEKSLIYALGRGLSFAEKKATVDRISMILERDGKFLPTLIEAIVTTDSFRKRVATEI